MGEQCQKQGLRKKDALRQKRRLWGGTDAPPGPRFRIDPIPGRGPVSPGGGKNPALGTKSRCPKPAMRRYNRGKQIELLRGVSMASPVLRTARRRNKGEPSLNPSICYVVGAMPLSWSLCPHPGAQDFLIAADKGYEALEAYGVPPNLVVGDFDSLGRPTTPNVVQLPAAKGDTDMVYALREGLDRGYRRFVLLGGVGGSTGAHSGQPPGPGLASPPRAPGRPGGEGTVATPSGTRP